MQDIQASFMSWSGVGAPPSDLLDFWLQAHQTAFLMHGDRTMRLPQTTIPVLVVLCIACMRLTSAQRYYYDNQRDQVVAGRCTCRDLAGNSVSCACLP